MKNFQRFQKTQNNNNGGIAGENVAIEVFVGNLKAGVLKVYNFLITFFRK